MTEPSNTKRMARALVARVSDEYFALPLTSVLEAVDAPEILPVPLAPKGLLGQCSYRGGMLPVLDPELLLGTARGGEDGMLLVMAGVEIPFGLWVDDLTDMVAVEGVARRALPPGSDRTGMLRGLIVVEDWLAGVVNLEALHSVASSLLASSERGSGDRI